MIRITKKGQVLLDGRAINGRSGASYMGLLRQELMSQIEYGEINTEQAFEIDLPGDEFDPAYDRIHRARSALSKVAQELNVIAKTTVIDDCLYVVLFTKD